MILRVFICDRICTLILDFPGNIRVLTYLVNTCTLYFNHIVKCLQTQFKMPFVFNDNLLEEPHGLQMGNPGDNVNDLLNEPPELQIGNPGIITNMLFTPHS